MISSGLRSPRGLLPIAGACVLLAGMAASPSRADTYPSRTITIITPFAAGSVTDATARMIGQYLQDALGQSVIVENRAGAGGLPAANVVARAKPDALTYASSGNGSVNHLLGEMLKSEADIKMLHVPYRGVAPAITDVIGGQVDAAFSSVPSVLQMIQSGNVRALAISSARRIAAAPAIPTIAESGFPGFHVNPWWGILAPAGADMATVAKINADVEAILKKLDDDQDEDFEWGKSITDLMKLLKLDSSLGARKQLAKELGYTGALDGSAEMNLWLHRQVMTKLAESGGRVPDSLKA